MAALAALLTACGRKPNPNAPAPPSEAEKAGYLPAPQVLTVEAAPDGAPVIRGKARPSGRIRATLPSGEAYGATADSQGRFELELPPGRSAVMVAISAEDAGRSTPAEGWLFVPPGDYARAVMLRAGAPSFALSPASPLISVVDFDAAGAAGVSGRAGPGLEVRLTVDGTPAAQDRADENGAYTLRLGPRSGLHRLHALADGRSQERVVDFSPLAQPPTGAFAVARVADGWRIDWRPPGGGAQTTYVFSGGSPGGAS
ncbi:MAG: hypothetical protein K1X35_04175 [Caulobacteraceae bacterium]|nr:hypothetical protein [Caulobacteraceae bacterium]